MNQITVPSKQIAWLTRPAFTSRKREAVLHVANQVTFHNTFWDGGSKNTYKAVKIEDGKVASLETGSSPWTAIAEGKTVTLEPGVVIVEESIFCGKVMKLHVYIHPSNVAPLLNP